MRQQEKHPPLHQLTGAPLGRPGDQVIPQQATGFLDQRTVDFAQKKVDPKAAKKSASKKRK